MTKEVLKLQEKVKKAEKRTKLRAARMINTFVSANYNQAMNTSETYGMSYEYHTKCAIIATQQRINALKSSGEDIKKSKYLNNALVDERKVLNHLRVILRLEQIQ
jgi:hypothetical protein